MHVFDVNLTVRKWDHARRMQKQTKLSRISLITTICICFDIDEDDTYLFFLDIDEDDTYLYFL